MSESIQNPQQVIDALAAQCEASKQMHNDLLNSAHQLRTQLIMVQKQYQILNNQHLAEVEKNKKLTAEIETLKLPPVVNDEAVAA